MDTHQNLVLAGIDGSVLTPAVCDYAAWIAHRVGAPLKLLHTIDHHPETAIQADMTGNIGLDSQDHLMEEIISLEAQRSKLRLQQGKQLLQMAKERVVLAGIADPIVNQRHGSLIESLIELESAIRVLVLGIRGRIHENQPHTLGAKLEAIIRSLHKPILVVNAPFSAPQRLMLVYDGSREAEKAVEMVASSPLYAGLACHLIGVGDDDDSGRESLERARTRLDAAKLQSLVVEKLTGKPEFVLTEYEDAHAIDLVVMGAFRHGRLHDLLLGSFTLKMLTRSHKPLLLLR